MILLFVALSAIVLAAIISAMAWRGAQEERRRSAARIAALAADIRDWSVDPVSAQDWSVDPGSVDEWSLDPVSDTESGTETSDPSGELFTNRQQDQGNFRFAKVAAAVLFVCGSIAALAVVSSSASGPTPVRNDSATAGGPRARDAAKVDPLELVALGHQLDGDLLTVRGVVRNPSSGAGLDRVTAVVLAFKEDGGFVGSGRATVDSTGLGPGGETAFTVAVPAASQVARYRVSFRTEDRIVQHVDRRGRTENLIAGP